MRCLACDAVMKPEEIIWIETRKTHETLCRVCRKSINDTSIFHIEDESVEDYCDDYNDTEN